MRWQSRREREPSWVWVNGEWVDELPSWASDVKDFSRDLATAGASIARAGGRALVQTGRTAVEKWRERGSVSPSIAERNAEPAANSNPVPLAEAHPPSPVTLPSIQAEEIAPPKLSRAQTLPFRKRQAAESGEARDASESRGDVR